MDLNVEKFEITVFIKLEIFLMKINLTNRKVLGQINIRVLVQELMKAVVHSRLLTSP